MVVLLSEQEAVRPRLSAPATYHSGTPRLQFWNSDLGLLATIDDIELNTLDLTICSQSLKNSYASF